MEETVFSPANVPTNTRVATAARETIRIFVNILFGYIVACLIGKVKKFD